MKKYLVPLSKKNRAKIAVQAESWRKHRSFITDTTDAKLVIPFITISRQFGCGAFPLAEAIANRLTKEDDSDYPWAVYDRALVQRIAEDHKMTEELVASLGQENKTELEESVMGLMGSFTPELKIYRSMVSTIKALAMHGRVIIVGRGGAILTRDMPGGFHIRLIAPFDWRADKVKAQSNMTLQAAKEYVTKMDAEREQFLQKYLNADCSDPYYYHLILNNSKMNTEQMVETVVSVVKKIK